MLRNLPKTIKVGEYTGGHVQGIAMDRERKYLYLSFTTCLVKAELSGRVVGSVSGLAGHLGCIAYNCEDGRIYGSLEYKNDQIGRGILSRIGRQEELRDGFYIAVFDVEKIDRMDMDAEKDGVMTAVYLKEVVDDYSAEGHRYGCSGIDGVTFAPEFGGSKDKRYLYVAYGIYGENERTDNDHQVVLRYGITDWQQFAKPLDQNGMHCSGPEKPDGKYFVYTGNTTYGIQNLEYDPTSDLLLAAVYPGRKERFPNYPMFFFDRSKAPTVGKLKGTEEQGKLLSLAQVGLFDAQSGMCGSMFPYGSTGMIALGDGLFYFSEDYRSENGFGTVVRLYRFDSERADFFAV